MGRPYASGANHNFCTDTVGADRPDQPATGSVIDFVQEFHINQNYPYNG